jgi:hypothetical protein
MKNRNRLITALIILVVFSLLPCSAFGEIERFDVPVGNAVFLGPADAPITIIEFLDFQ